MTRTRGSGAWREMMLPEDVAYLRSRFGSALAARGYSDWDIHPAGSNPAVGSDYVLKVADEALRLTGGWSSFPPRMQTPRNIR